MRKTKLTLGFMLIMLLALSYNVIYAQDYALQFNGVDEYVQTTYGGEIQTLEFWFKTNSFNTSDGLFGQRYDSDEESGNWQMHWDETSPYNKLRIYAYDRGGEMVTTASFEAGQWYHVAITSEANDLNFYINGIHDSQHTWMECVLGGCNNDDDLTIGGSFGNENLYPFDGEIDEVRVWSDVRTEAEIQEYLCCGLTGTEDNLIAYYTMSDGSGTTLTDNSTNSYTGTLHNMGDENWVTISEASYSGGSGTSGDPYQIASTNDLINLSNIFGCSCWDDYFIQTADISFDADSTTVDWNNSGSSGPAEGFSPIGNSASNFTGSYDGGGYTIDNLFIDRPSTDYVGIFGKTSGTATIENLGLIGNYIKGNRYVGGIAGYNNGYIYNCYTEGPVTAYNQDVGGIAGTNYGPIINCHATGDIEATGHADDCQTAGGLVGDHRGSIDNCYATGDVSVSTSGNTTGFEVGGLAGYVYSTPGISVTNSYATGTVTGVEEVGGLIGDNKCHVSGCYATGNVFCHPTSTDYYHHEGGGFVGVNTGDIDNCYSIGSVTQEINKDDEGYGGFVGRFISGTISYCFTNGSVFFTGASDPTNDGFSGYEDGTLTNTYNFFDYETSNQSSTCYGATSKTTAQMKTQNTFTNWNFDAIWNIDGTTNSGYPFLRADPQFTWTGTASTDWANGSNWTGTTSPTYAARAIIPDETNDPVIGNGVEATCNYLTIQSSAMLTIESGGYLTASGPTTVTGTLTIGSGGSFIGNGVLYNNGTIDVDRSVSAWSGASHGWHFLSSPVTSQTINPTFTDDPPENYDFYAWYEPTDQWVNYKNTTTTPVWNTANELSGTSGEGDFIPGKGYLVAYASTDTKTFTGDLNTVDISVTGLTKTTNKNYLGWHLLGNPYTSALIWNDGNWSLNNIDDNCQIWKETDASYSIISSGNDIIPALNGFMVHANTDGASLTIPRAARTHDGTSWYKSTNGYINAIILTAHDPQGQTAQPTIVRFNPEATDEYDSRFDSYFLSGYAPRFYSVSNDENYALNTLPQLTHHLTIPLSFIKNGSSGFYIKAEGIENLMTDYPIYLTDLKTNTTQNLTSNPIYTFTAEDGDDSNRFLLHFKTVGIEEQPTTQSNIHAWATKQTVYLLNPDNNKGEIRILNIFGQEVLRTKLTGNNKQEVSINVSSGTYIVSIIIDKELISKKVFVN